MEDEQLQTHPIGSLVIKSIPKPGLQPKEYSKVLKICELFDAGHYDQVANLLYLVQKDSNYEINKFPSEILEAAYQICLACQEFRNEKAQHQKAFEDASKRELALTNHLREIINLFKQCEPNENEDKHQAQNLIKVETEFPDHTKLFDVWQRIQNSRLLKKFQQAIFYRSPSELVNRASHRVIDEGNSIVSYRDSKDSTISNIVDQNIEDQSHPTFMIYCLGQFQVYQNNQLVQEWPSSKGKAIFKYLVANRKYPTPKEVLMELFWSGASPDAARNNLNVSIYGLRQALRSVNPDYSHILFHEESYLLNPDMNIWIDVEEFTKRFQSGNRKEKRREISLAIQEYQGAEAIYQGEFLSEDRYEDWLLPLRQTLQDNYLKLLDRLSHHYIAQKDFAACVAVCNKMLAVDPCREEAHRQLMHCYSCQGQPYLATRQYHICEEALRGELDLSPSKLTEDLYQRIRAGQ